MIACSYEKYKYTCVFLQFYNCCFFFFYEMCLINLECLHFVVIRHTLFVKIHQLSASIHSFLDLVDWYFLQYVFSAWFDETHLSNVFLFSSSFSFQLKCFPRIMIGCGCCVLLAYNMLSFVLYHSSNHFTFIDFLSTENFDISTIYIF